jgi:hypothetical protein
VVYKCFSIVSRWYIYRDRQYLRVPDDRLEEGLGLRGAVVDAEPQGAAVELRPEAQPVLLHRGLLLGRRRAWERQALSARGFKRVGRRSEHAI